jgi:hypothetical protein
MQYAMEDRRLEIIFSNSLLSQTRLQTEQPFLLSSNTALELLDEGDAIA